MNPCALRPLPCPSSSSASPFAALAAVLALPLLGSSAACGGPTDYDAMIQTTDPTGFDAGETEDFVATAADFGCLHEAKRVDRVNIRNPLGHLDEAVAVAEAGTGAYPVGTILQLVPQEAMVKRAPGFDPETRDWEMFFLAVDAEGTTILERGGAEVHGAVGRCAECHGTVADEFDFTCRDDRCDPNPNARSFFATLVDHDPRCRQ